MSKSNIALIGFMATGKTTVGEALVKYLGSRYSFIETDKLIIQNVGRDIPRIFTEEGEEKFREYEIAACKQASLLNNVVISCGGGVVLNKVNINNLRQKCHIVLLKASSQEIYNRAMKDGKETRPIINKEDPKSEIENVLQFRNRLYDSAAEFVIETTGKKINDIVLEIVKKTHLKT
ncbi:MAG: shikimate kinase [Promethearchaeota archaeon]|jgi:shikimate kinase